MIIVNKGIFCAVFLFVLILSATLTYAAAGASPPSKEARTFVFEPGMEQTWTLTVHGSEELTVSIIGVLAPYVTLHDPDPEGGPRSVSYTIKAPDTIDLPPGDHWFFLRVAEAAHEGMVGTQAAVNVIHVGQYYTPEPYLVADLHIANAEEKKATQASIDVTSYSTKVIQDVRLDWEIRSAGGEDVLLAGEQLLFPALEPLAKETVTMTLPIESLTPGQYSFTTNLTYQGGEPIPLSDTFRIGEFTADLLSSPETIYRGKINKVNFAIYNAWNLAVPDARLFVQIPDLDISEEAPVISIAGFGQGQFTTYLEPSVDAELRDYEGTVTLRMGIDERSQTVSFPFTVRVLDPADDVEGAARQVVEERPGVFSFTLNPLIGAYVLVLLLVLINLYFLLKQKKK